MKTATLLPDEVAHDETGEVIYTDTAVYRLDPPLLIRDGITDYVVASTLAADLGPYTERETMLWISDEEGMVVDWRELPGSGRNRGHAEALAAAGYTVVASIGVNA